MLLVVLLVGTPRRNIEVGGRGRLETIVFECGGTVFFADTGHAFQQDDRHVDANRIRFVRSRYLAACCSTSCLWAPSRPDSQLRLRVRPAGVLVAGCGAAGRWAAGVGPADFRVAGRLPSTTRVLSARGAG